MGTINNSFDKLYLYIQSRKDIDNKHSSDIEDLKDKVVNLAWSIKKALNQESVMLEETAVKMEFI